MTTRTKSSVLTLTGAVLLFLTVIIRHTTDNPASKPWIDVYLPIAGFLLIAIGMYYSVKARREPKG